MADAIGQVLWLGVVVAVSPVPIIAIVLVLGTPRARTSGPAFVFGWILGLGVVGTIVLVAAGGVGASEGSEPADWVGVLKLMLGALLVLVAVRQWRGRPQGSGDAAVPGWASAIGALSPARALALAAALSGANPKHMLLTVAAATAIAETDASAGDEAIAMAVFAAVGTLGTGIPVALYFALGERATGLLDEVKAWMIANNTAMMAALFLVIGVKLIGDGITVLG